ncbi:MAG: hypothetical protein V4642_12260 [Bacteroidota bacterium]
MQQRFELVVFIPLAFYLIFYARPGVLPSEDGSGGIFTVIFLVLILVLIFCFRLFDDLWNREIDAGKPDRIYTDINSHTILKNFLIGFFAVVLCTIWFFNNEAAAVLTGFSLLNFFAYFLLFKKWKWRFILPLLKYPFLYFLLCIFLKNSAFSQYEILIGISLLPAFLLFEIFDDKEFFFSDWIIFSIFLAGNSLLLFANPTSVFAWILAGIGVVVFLLTYKNHADFKDVFPYAILIYFLILRLLVQV